MSVLERILHRAASASDLRFAVRLFETRSNPHGSGCHVSSQPAHLLLNTASDQICIVPRSPAAAIPRHAGELPDPNSLGALSHLTFDAWLIECMQQSRHLSLINLNSEGGVRDTYQPRALFGFYLQDLLARLIQAAPSNVDIELVTDAVADLRPASNGQWILQGREKHHPPCDFVYLCTGHHLPRGSRSLRHAEQAVPDRSTVAVKGMGLTAFDTVAGLTIGRGGRFVPDDSPAGLRYEPSGREPRILAFSRSGLPLQARPVNRKTSVEQRVGSHFTLQAVREAQSAGPVDFQKQLLPLILQDAEEAFYLAMHRSGTLPESARALLEHAQQTGTPDWAPLVAAELPSEQRFNWDALSQPVPDRALDSPESYRAFFEQYLLDDLHQARLGNLHSPRKAACDVLRDHRERMAAAIDFKGLTGESQRWLYEEFLPLLKRLSVGPPKERIAQWIALSQAGILHADLGPDVRIEYIPKGVILRSERWPQFAVLADALLDARLPVDGPGDDPLLERLCDSGVARYFQNSDYSSRGLDVDRKLNLIGGDGRPVPTVWALGVATEGSRFYTFFLPRPYARSRFEQDAETAVDTMFERIAGSQSALSDPASRADHPSAPASAST